MTFAGLDGTPTEPYTTDWNNFGPRIGFAWKALGDEMLVVRGGFGVAFVHPVIAKDGSKTTFG